MRDLPEKLKQGDTIGVVSPSNFVDEEDMPVVEASKKLLEENGFKVKFAKNCFKNTTGYGATANEKAEDIMQMYEDNEVKAIMSLKGGFNSNSVYEYLDLEEIKKHNKILCGYSDATSYINYISAKTGNIGFVGPNFKTLTRDEERYCFKNFLSHMCEGSKELLQKDDECKTIFSGKKAEGKLIGGNLSLITKLSDELDFEGKILFLEEFAFESPAALVSGNIYSLKQKGVFNKIAGLWIGNYDGDILLEKIIMDTIEDLDINYPIIKSNNFGHTERIMSIPIGAKARIEENNIEIIEDYLK